MFQRLRALLNRRKFNVTKPLTLSQILEDDQAENTLKWVRAMKSGAARFDKNFNWLLLGEVASDNAHQHKSLDWAHVAIEVYEWPDWKSALGWNVDGYVSVSMSVRMAMVSHFGPKPQHDVLDPEKVSQLFCSYIPVSLEAALLIARNYREAEDTKINRRENREASEKIHRLYGRLELLDECKRKGFLIHSEAEPWLAAKPMLNKLLNTPR